MVERVEYSTERTKITHGDSFIGDLQQQLLSSPAKSWASKDALVEFEGNLWSIVHKMIPNALFRSKFLFFITIFYGSS